MLFRRRTFSANELGICSRVVEFARVKVVGCHSLFGVRVELKRQQVVPPRRPIRRVGRKLLGILGCFGQWICITNRSRAVLGRAVI